MARTLDQAKRTAILSAAERIFIRDGYDAAKISDIAVEAGVAPGTLYLYFENKEALAGAIGEAFFIRLFTQFGEIVQQIEGPEGVVELVDWALKIAADDTTIFTMAKERRHGPKSKSKAEGRMRLVEQVSQAFTRLMEQGIIRHYDDPQMLADLVLALMRRLLLSRALYEDENTDTLKASAVAMLQHTLFDDVTLSATRLLARKRKNAGENYMQD